MTSLAKYTAGIFLLGLSLFGACKSPETLPADQLAIRPGESGQIGELTVQVDTLQMSGCGRCIIAYSVFVSALVSTTTAQQRVGLMLYGVGPRRDSTSVTLAGQPYKIILRDITPHPENDLGYGSTKAGDTRAVIQVTKL